MTRIVRLISGLIAAAALLAVTLTAAAAMLLYFNRDYLKESIMNEINRISDYRYSAERIDFELFPALSLKLKNVSVERVVKDRQVDILKAGSIETGFSHMEMLRKKVRIKNFSMTSGRVTLYRDLPAGESGGGSGSDLLSDLKKINLKDISVIIADSYQAQSQNPSAEKSVSFSELNVNISRMRNTGDLSFDYIITEIHVKNGSEAQPVRSINVNGTVDYSMNGDNIRISDTKIVSGGIFDGIINGNISSNANTEIELTAEARKVDLDRFIKLIADSFSLMPERGGGGKTISRIKIRSAEVKAYDRTLTGFICQLYIIDNYIIIKESGFRLYGGDIKCRGTVITGKSPEYKLHLTSSGTGIEKLELSLSGKSYITGTLDANLEVSSRGATPELLKQNLESRGSLIIRKGELKDYADILKPVFELGKIVNIFGPKGDSTAFDEIRTDYRISNGRIRFSSIKMKGVGLDAEGYGTLGFDGSINVRIVVGLGGVVGKLIKIPVIYKGVVLKSWPYVDPLWLGSIYVGMVAIPGPPGAIIGPTVYESARELINKFKFSLNPFRWKR